MFHNVSKVVLCGRRNIFASFSQDELHSSWQVHHFGDLHRHFAWQAQHFRGVVLCVFFFADRMVRAASGDVKVKISGQTWHFVRCDEN